MAPPAAAAAPPLTHFSGTAAAAGAAAKAAGAAAGAPADDGSSSEAAAASSLHRRLQRLTAQLAVLEYTQPVGGLEGVPLVERLLGDLVATSEAYEKLQGREERVAQDLALSQVGVGGSGGWGVGAGGKRSRRVTTD